MANQMFRIVDKRNGKVIYSQVLSSCNKAEMVERAKMWCSSHSFKNEEEVKKHQIEFSYFTWKNYMHNGYGRMIGRSNYRYGWHCTTVCNLEQNNDMLSIGSLIAGRALDSDTAKKAKGGRYGEMMIDTLGC